MMMMMMMIIIIIIIIINICDVPDKRSSVELQKTLETAHI
jgi:hypothetical protein